MAKLSIRLPDKMKQFVDDQTQSGQFADEEAYIQDLISQDCVACHSARGGEPMAGGRRIDTPFGSVFSSNLTPHATGLGGWSAAEFHRALHHGQSRDGRLLYPAFPYNNTTQVSREDSDALYAYLRQLPPVDAPQPRAQVLYITGLGRATLRAGGWPSSVPRLRPLCDLEPSFD